MLACAGPMWLLSANGGAAAATNMPHTHRHRGVRSCSANVVLQEAVISVRAMVRVKTVRTEISIAGWDLTVRGGGEDERTAPGWGCEIENRPVVEAEREIQMLQLGEGSAMIEQQQIFPAALPGHSRKKTNRRSFLLVDIKGRIKHRGYWITINICSLRSLVRVNNSV